MAGLTMSSVEASAQDVGFYAWWLTAKVPVAGDTVAGIPISQLQPEWRSASALSLNHLPTAAHQPGESPADHHAAFTLVADLDGDGKAERSLVGVYEKSSGERGRFLLVLARRAKGWSKRALFESKGETGFSFLSWSQGRLIWSECMECDVLCAVVTRGKDLALECSACEDCA